MIANHVCYRGNTDKIRVLAIYSFQLHANFESVRGWLNLGSECFTFNGRKLFKVTIIMPNLLALILAPAHGPCTKHIAFKFIHTPKFELLYYERIKNLAIL